MNEFSAFVERKMNMNDTIEKKNKKEKQISDCNAVDVDQAMDSAEDAFLSFGSDRMSNRLIIIIIKIISFQKSSDLLCNQSIHLIMPHQSM